MFLGERQWRVWSWGPPAGVGRLWSWGLWAKAPQDHTGLMSPPPAAALSWGRPSEGPPSQHQEDQRERPPRSEFSAYERISLHLKREHQVFKLHPSQELRGLGHTTHPWENQAVWSVLSQGSFLPHRPAPLPSILLFLILWLYSGPKVFKAHSKPKRTIYLGANQNQATADQHPLLNVSLLAPPEPGCCAWLAGNRI